jgi:hypothetical protein
VRVNGLGKPHPYDLAICRPHGLSLVLVSLIACDFSLQILTFLTSPTSWVPQCRLGFTLTVSCLALSGTAYMATNPVIHCLASQAFLWNLSGSLHHNSCILHICKTRITWKCQGLLPAQAVGGSSWTTAEEATECLMAEYRETLLYFSVSRVLQSSALKFLPPD